LVLDATTLVSNDATLFSFGKLLYIRPTS
jgi:hypothetical protein